MLVAKSQQFRAVRVSRGATGSYSVPGVGVCLKTTMEDPHECDVEATAASVIS